MLVWSFFFFCVGGWGGGGVIMERGEMCASSISIQIVV